MSSSVLPETNVPLVVALGGTTRSGSSTEKALRIVLQGAEAEGARTELICGPDISLPPYAPELPDRTPAAVHLVERLRAADGIIIGSPGYHGSISGMVKNALDYAEDLRGDVRPYFDGRAVGSVATGAGWQGAVNTLAALRNIVHALRGWNTPLGVAINTAEPAFNPDGSCVSHQIQDMLLGVGAQVVRFARHHASTK